jgi:hypothetical protein
MPIWCNILTNVFGEVMEQKMLEKMKFFGYFFKKIWEIFSASALVRISPLFKLTLLEKR